MIKCDVVIGVNASHTVDESASNNFKIHCNREANYSVKPNCDDDIVFFCCLEHSKLFSNKDYNFARIK